MQSDKIKNTEEKAEKTEVCEVTSEYKKQRFGLKIFSRNFGNSGHSF